LKATAKVEKEDRSRLGETTARNRASESKGLYSWICEGSPAVNKKKRDKRYREKREGKVPIFNHTARTRKSKLPYDRPSEEDFAAETQRN